MRERSAGILTFYQAPETGDRTWLLLNYGKHWDFPKGHVDPGETDRQAAVRELTEETGIVSVNLLPDFAREISYFFRHPKRGLIQKDVIFYLGQVSSQEVTLSIEHTGFQFLPFEEAVLLATFPAAKQLLRDAEAHLAASRQK